MNKARQTFEDLLEPLLVRASAGSGKTYDLSTRFLQLICLGELPQHILATTFTKKAAGEIRERIFQRLAKAALDPQAAQELSDAMKIAPFGPQQALEKLNALTRVQHRLNICTLDALFFRIASSFSLELGLPPVWRSAEQSIEEQCLHEAVRMILSKGDSEELSRLMQLLNRGDHKRSVHQKIEEVMRGWYELFRQTGESAWNWLPLKKGLSESEVEDAAERLNSLPLPTTNSGKPAARWVESIEQALTAIGERKWETFWKTGLVKSVLQGKSEYDRKKIDAAALAVLEPLIEHARAYLLLRMQRQLDATRELLTLFHQEFEEQKLRNAALTFSDIKLKLAAGAVTSDAAEMYYRLDCRLKHLLLDEFQDTSGVEWQVIEPLADEILSKASGESSFFCVGDVKQAIYGWRGGKAEIFDSLENRYEQLAGREKKESYRSAPAVIETVNQIFGGVAGNPELEKYASAARAWAKGFSNHETKRKQHQGYVSLEAVSVAAGEDGEAIEMPVFKKAAQRVKEFSDSCPQAQIGVLVRKNNAVANLLYEIGRLGVPASGEGGTTLDDSPAVSVVLSLLTLVDHPGDSVARYHVAASPLGAKLNYTDFKSGAAALALAHQLKSELQQAGYGQTIFRLAERLKESCGLRDQRRLSQLVALGHRFDNQPELRPGTFVELVRNTRMEDPAPAQVRVMTVHQAKGLEFDIVILPELDFRLKGLTPPFLTWFEEATKPPALVARYVDEIMRLTEPRLDAMCEQHNELELREALCLLYVAITRAKYALCMLIKNPLQLKTKSLTYASIIRAALAPQKYSKPELLFELGDMSWKELFAGPRAGRTEKRSAEVFAFKEPDTSRTKAKSALVKISPSRIRQTKVMVDDFYDRSQRAARERGVLLHLLFSKITWLEDGVPGREELLELTRDLLSAEAAEPLLDEFHAVVSAPALKEVFSLEALNLKRNEVNLGLELPFALLDGQNLLNGVFDRVVMVHKNGAIKEVKILDYKTDRIEGGPAAEKLRIEHYKPQMEAYRKAAAAMYGLPEQQIEASVIFTSLKKVARVF